MVYRKFKADYLFDGREMIRGDKVLVTTEDGTIQAILPLAEAGEGIEIRKGILSPGFVNCHCHLELSHLRGMIPEKTGLIDFLLSVIKKRAFPSEERVAALVAAEEAMLLNGIVAVGDICNTTDSLLQKTEGNLYYHNFIETMGFIDQGAPDRFESSLQVFNAFAEAYSLPIEANSIVPHAPYSVSPALFQRITRFPGNHLLTIHNQESAAENSFYQSGRGEFLRLYEGLGLDVSFFKGTGKRSLESILGHFTRNQTLILVHNVDTREEDLRAARDFAPNLFFCLCPNANLYIGGQLPQVEELIRQGCSIVIGTDSLASNHQLNILEELKTLQQHFPGLSTATLLQWATLNGAEALQLDRVVGSFVPGKKPGVLLIEGLEGAQITGATQVERLA